MVEGRIFAAFLAGVMALSPVAPPEHVHDRDDHGHHAFVVHRHVPPHVWGHDDFGILGSRGVDDDDAPIATLNPVYIPQFSSVEIGVPVSAGPLAFAPSSPRVSMRSVDVERLIHGPPRTSNGLRAPPVNLS